MLIVNRYTVFFIFHRLPRRKLLKKVQKCIFLFMKSLPDFFVYLRGMQHYQCNCFNVEVKIVILAARAFHGIIICEEPFPPSAANIGNPLPATEGLREMKGR
jgi:hypothetical protein